MMSHSQAKAAPTFQAKEIKQRFASELSKIVRQSRFRAAFDALLHQSLVILAGVAGFCALAAGLIWSDKAWIAGILGAVPSLSSVLARQLHCVRAANWHRRRSVKVDALQHRLEYELPPEPTSAQIAELSEQLRSIELELMNDWEAMTRSDETQTLGMGAWRTQRGVRSGDKHG
jgi:hypothetical protein